MSTMTVNRHTKIVDELAGFFCECGHLVTFNDFVFAHWDQVVYHTCRECQREHLVCRGEVEEVVSDRGVTK